ncbi:MAG: NAD-dependent epimerase/dehydratase family protein [Armatimonadetes bacterium]|nr:NAD-dependent epimerase/dehydratase family protein [Armatimonadota bacterium]
MKVLVTGGTGFLGGCVVRALLARGDTVRVLGRNPAACAALEQLGVEVRRGDLREQTVVVDACQGMDAVCHAGAFSAPWGEPAEFLASNVRGTEHVLKGCSTHGVWRLVHISSPSVTFHGQDQVNATEAVPRLGSSLSVYSTTKKLAEGLVQQAIDAGQEAVILRPKAIFGPGDTSLVPRLLAAARRGRLPQIGDGTNQVDLTYVENVAQAVLLALEPAIPAGGTYTITNGESVLLWEVVRRILAHVGLSTRLRRISLGQALLIAQLMETASAFTRKEPLLTRYTVTILARTQTYDISAARRDLGYVPAVPLEEGIRRTLAALKTEAPRA